MTVRPRQYKDKSPQAKSAATFGAEPRQSSKATPWGRAGRQFEPSAKIDSGPSDGPGRPGRAKKVVEFTRSDPAVVLPRHVRACQHSAEHKERWFVWTWKRDSTHIQTRVPYSCNSWRCPVCARHEAAVTFARIKQACGRPELDPTGWVYLVLTLDRDGYYTGRPWPNVTAAYKALGKQSERLLKRLRRRYALGNQWVAVVEAHRSGWPHMNLMAYCPELAAELRSEAAERERSGSTKREQILLGGDLLGHAMECGWGRQSTAEGARSTDALAGYIVKLAGTHDQSVGELAKVTQAPLAAPGRFRRLRSGKGFLPPRHSNPETTGALVRRRRSREGDWEILAVNASKDPLQHEPIQRAIRAEQSCIEEEEDLLARWRRLPPLPPIRLAYGGKLEGHRDTSERRWATSLRSSALDG